MTHFLKIFSVIIFIFISGASVLVIIYLLKYPRDNLFNLILKPVLFFIAIFLIVSIPVLLGARTTYLFIATPLIFLLSLIIGIGSFTLTKIVEGLLQDKSNKNNDNLRN